MAYWPSCKLIIWTWSLSVHSGRPSTVVTFFCYLHSSFNWDVVDNVCSISFYIPVIACSIEIKVNLCDLYVQIEQVRRLHYILAIKDSALNVPVNLEARRRLQYFSNSLFMSMPEPPPVRKMFSFRFVIFSLLSTSGPDCSCRCVSLPSIYTSNTFDKKARAYIYLLLSFRRNVYSCGLNLKLAEFLMFGWWWCAAFSLLTTARM